jgi:hypothetical protein
MRSRCVVQEEKTMLHIELANDCSVDIRMLEKGALTI